MRGDVTDAGQTTDDKQLKIELLSQWKLEAESRKKAGQKGWQLKVRDHWAPELLVKAILHNLTNQ